MPWLSSGSADTADVVHASSGISATDDDASATAASSQSFTAMRPQPLSSLWSSFFLFPGLPDGVLFLSLSYLTPWEVHSLLVCHDAWGAV